MRYTFGAYLLDTACYELYHRGTLVPLRPKVLEVLAYLVVHHDRVVSKQELLAQLWPDRVIGEDGLKAYIMAVRQALGERGSAPQLLRTVRGRGYRVVAPVTTAEPAPLAPTRAPTPQPVGALPGPAARRAPVVGRETELAQLSRWWEQVQGGARHLVFVTGEPGIGKTTLVDVWLARLAGEAPLWIGYGQCIEAYGTGEPYQPVLEALGRVCRGPGGEAVVAELGAQAPTWLGQMPGLVPAGDLETLQRRLAGATRERMLRELAEALERLTAQQPLVLVLEDLQWSDPSTLDLLAVLARRREPARLLLLGTYRSPEGRAQGHPLAAVLHELQRHGHSMALPVPRLTEEAIAAYLSSRVPGLPGIDALTRLVYQHTEGNPLFMVMLVDAWLAAGVLCEQDGAWDLPGGVEALHDQVPDSVRRLIDGQLDRLSIAEQRVLEAASVAGVEFMAAAVAAGLGQAVERVDEACAALARRGQWLRAVGEQDWPDGTVAGRYRFGHTLYQQVLYRRVAAARRVQLHRRMGAREELGYGAAAETRASALAVHFARGRDYPRAVQYLRQAGEQALQRSAHREAVGAFEQALSALAHLPDTRDTRTQAIDLRLALRSALYPSGDLGRMLTCLREAETLAVALDDPGRLGQISDLLTVHWYFRGVYDQAIATGQRAVALATTSRDVVLHALANLNLSAVYYAQGDYQRAIDCAEQTAAFFDGARSRERASHFFSPAVQSRARLAWCYAELGRFSAGTTRGAEGVQMAEAGENTGSRMFAYYGLGLVALRQGHLPKALPLLERAVELCRAADLPLFFPRMAVAMGAAYSLGGRVADALPLLTQVMEQAMATARIEFLVLCGLALGEAQVLAGALKEAQALTERTLALTRAHQERGHEAYALRLLGAVAARRDPPDVAEAANYYGQALALAAALGMRPLQAHCHWGLGRLYGVTGQRKQARAELSTAIAMYRGMEMTFWLPQAEAALAQVNAR